MNGPPWQAYLLPVYDQYVRQGKIDGGRHKGWSRSRAEEVKGEIPSIGDVGFEQKPAGITHDFEKQAQSQSSRERYRPVTKACEQIQGHKDRKGGEEGDGCRHQGRGPQEAIGNRAGFSRATSRVAHRHLGLWKKDLDGKGNRST